MMMVAFFIISHYNCAVVVLCEDNSFQLCETPHNHVMNKRAVQLLTIPSVLIGLHYT